jgi:hypothetical protein
VSATQERITIFRTLEVRYVFTPNGHAGTRGAAQATSLEGDEIDARRLPVSDETSAIAGCAFMTLAIAPSERRFAEDSRDG